MKNILALHPSVELYGADRIFVNTLSLLKKSGKVENITVLLPQKGALSSFLEESVTKAKILHVPYIPIAVRSTFGLKSLFIFFLNCCRMTLYFFTKRNWFTCIYLNTLSLSGCAILARIAGCQRIISHSHEMVSHHGVFAKLLINICVVFSHKIICVSNAVKQDMISALIIKRFFVNKIHVVHNGIKPESYSSPIQSNKIQILLLGRIMPEKGQWFLLDSLAKISSERRNHIIVKIVGSPPPNREHLLSQFFEKIRSMSLESIVDVIPFIKDPSNLIRQSHICIVPSIMPDPFPTTVLEAMAFGRVVITTNHGGAKEIIDDGKTGFLVDPNNTQQLSSLLDTLIVNFNLIQTIGAASHTFFNSYLTETHFQSRLLEQFPDE